MCPAAKGRRYRGELTSSARCTASCLECSVKDTNAIALQVQGSKSSVKNLMRWLIEAKGLPPQKADVIGVRPDGEWTAFTNQDIKEGEVGLSHQDSACDTFQAPGLVLHLLCEHPQPSVYDFD